MSRIQRGYCSVCSIFTDLEIGIVGDQCERCRDNEYVRFPWEDYCVCAEYQAECHDCYEKKVSDYVEESQAAAIAVRHVQRTRYRTGAHATNRRPWRFRTVGTCPSYGCTNVGLVGDRCPVHGNKYKASNDHPFAEWSVFGNW